MGVAGEIRKAECVGHHAGDLRVERARRKSWSNPAKRHEHAEMREGLSLQTGCRERERERQRHRERKGETEREDNTLLHKDKDLSASRLFLQICL